MNGGAEKAGFVYCPKVSGTNLSGGWGADL